MHPTNRDRGLRLGVLVLLGLLVVGGAAAAQDPAPPPRPDPRAGRNPSLLIPIGGSQQITMATNKPIASVFLTGEGVARVAPGPQNKYIIVSGVAAGAVGLKLTDVDGKEEWYDIVVQLDTTYIKQIIRQAVPTSNVDVIAAFNRTVILTGWVARGEDVETVLKVARAVLGSVGAANAGAAPGAPGATPVAASEPINAIRVGGVQQVQLDVTVASVNRTEARRRGFNWAYNGSTVSLGSILGGLTQVSPSPGIQATGIGINGPIASPNPPNPGPNIIFGVIPANFQALLLALKDEQLAKVLAEPKVLAMSGRPAEFLSGGQQAVQSASGGLGGPGVEFRDVGTKLEFLPIVLGNGRIYLEVSPRFRAVNAGRGIVLAGSLTPGFDEQSVRTAIEMEPGQTFAIGGLIQTTVQSTASRVPVLGSLPFVGTAFSQVVNTVTEEELVILVTPHLVDAQDCNQLTKRLPGRETRTPDDFELFLEGLLEAPRGQRQVFENGKYKAAYKNDPSLRQFPCADPLPKEARGGMRNGGGCATGACGTVPGRLPVDMKNDPGAMPPAAGDPNLRIVPDRETLPAPAAGGDLPSIRIGPAGDRGVKSGPSAPAMPAPPDGN